MGTDNADSILAQAKIVDLHRRIQQLESTVNGAVPAEWSWRDLADLYVEASMLPSELTIELALHWDRSIRHLNVVELLLIGRHFRDPFPWRVFVRAIDLFAMSGFHLTAALTHLNDRAQELLNVQGLSKLRPEDLALIPLRVELAANAAISIGTLQHMKSKGVRPWGKQRHTRLRTLRPRSSS